MAAKTRSLCYVVGCREGVHGTSRFVALALALAFVDVVVSVDELFA